MQHIVITLVGRDRPGLVDNVSKLIFAHQGNWLASSLSRMAGQFAGIVQVQLPEEQLPEFMLALDLIKDLRCVVLPSDDSTPIAAARQFRIEVTGNDKPGIVQEISRAIHSGGGNIIKLSSECEPAPNWGGELFRAHVLIAIDSEDQQDAICDALENVANDLIVDITQGAS